ncbi:MAG: hypothetical protein KGH76_06120 [Thaumarchaeota archaeon]|nr:hypothetical protein [Nitrososphaerota archaeon]MDE1842717.1 hypothetical protein [Nitrososphaerota archaeon]
MKTFHLSIITASGITSFIILGIYLILNPSDDVQPKVLITDIITTPKILHVGDHFTANATVKNVGSRTVSFFSNHISGIFDKHVVVSHYNGCSGVYGGNILMPSQSKELTFPSPGCDYYVANSSGTTNVAVKLLYNIQRMEYAVNASKEFTIFPKP